MQKAPRYAVIGDPIEHSLSPRIFEWLFKEIGLAGSYEALHVKPEELAGVLAQVRAGKWQGLSITIPHKETAMPLVDDVHPLAARIGAINCVMRTDEGQLKAFNTDALGFRRALEEQGGRLARSRLLLLGAGGAARSAAVAAHAAGAKSIVIANRSIERAEKLAGELKTAPITVVPLDGRIQPSVDDAEVLVNATSVGLSAPNDCPLPPEIKLRADLVVLDMVYRPLETALLARARAAGATVVDGLWMLVHQAIEQLRIWTGYAANPGLAERLYRYVKEIA